MSASMDSAIAARRFGVSSNGVQRRASLMRGSSAIWSRICWLFMMNLGLRSERFG